MRIVKTILAALMTLGIVVLSMSCSSNSSSTSTTKTITATVKKGNLAESITGTGNLTYSTTQKLAFDLSGYVEEVFVSAGDTVTKGDKIATLNASDWEDQITSLTKTLESAQRNLTAKQSALVAAQRVLTSKQTALTSAKSAVKAKELAVSQAQLDLQTAQYNLSQIADIKTAQDSLDVAKNNLDMAKASRAINDGNVSTDDLKYYQEQYDNAVARLEKIKSGANTSISTSVALQVAQYQLQIQQKEQALTDAQTAVEAVQTSVSNAQLDITDAEQAITNAQLDITDAQQSVKEAQSALDTEKSLSPTITAPIDGYITKVNVSGGDEVFKGTVAAIIADPSQFEADIMVTENDIFSVKLNGTATVSLDALSSVTYPAKITYISPTATVSSGVVNYSVTVALTSLTPISTTQTTAQTTAMTMPSGTPPAGFTPPAGGMPSGTPPAMPAQGTTAPVSAGASDNSTAAESSQTADLKDGLSATVEIISKQANNVLVIPDKAIKTQGQSYTVQVVKGTTTETQIVQTGMSDGTNTEITSGLSEGDQVVYTVSISSSSTSSTSSKSGSQIIPGVGGGGPPGGGF